MRTTHEEGRCETVPDMPAMRTQMDEKESGEVASGMSKSQMQESILGQAKAGKEELGLLGAKPNGMIMSGYWTDEYEEGNAVCFRCQLTGECCSYQLDGERSGDFDCRKCNIPIVTAIMNFRMVD